MDNEKYTQTEQSIRHALYALMTRQPYSSITVIQIVKEADVNRKTFYSYYASKQDCYCSLIRSVFAALFDCFLHAKPSFRKADSAMLEQDIRRFILAAAQYRDALDTLITPETSALAFSIADEIIIGRNGLFFFDEHIPESHLNKQLHVESIRSFLFILIDLCTTCGDVPPDTLLKTILGFMHHSCASLLGYGGAAGDPA